MRTGRYIKQRWATRGYDPYPDLAAMSKRLNTEAFSLAKEQPDPHLARCAIAGLRSTLESYIIYATVGRDRKTLGPDWVQRCERECRKHLDLLVQDGQQVHA